MTRKKYLTEEERLEAKRAMQRKYYQKCKKQILERQDKYRELHKDEIAERKAIYYQKHKQEIVEKVAKYNQTQNGRACYLINAHKREDKKNNRGECDLTVPWFVRNIFTKCIYCGESDWKKLGCDRIDNSLPHTIENVVPCCLDCNNKRQKKPFEQFYWESKHKTLGEES